MTGLLSARLSLSNAKILIIGLFLGFFGLSPVSVAAQTPSTTLSVIEVPFVPTSSLVQLPPTLRAFDPTEYGLAAAYAMTPKTKRELYAWNAEKSWPIASLTKLISALIWKNYTVPWQTTITLRSVDEVGGGRLRVPVGSKIRFEDLWYASITASANNAAMALVRVLGVTTKQATTLMNREIRRAGAKNAIVFEPSGMDVRNVASAHEMALIADRAFDWRPLQRAASTDTRVVKVISPNPRNHPVYSTNDLLRFDDDIWVIAGKTGYLDESRHNLVAWLRPVGVDGKPESGKDVLIVVYGAPTRERMFAAAKALAESLWSSDETLTSR